jgi:hypothetical protein
MGFAWLLVLDEFLYEDIDQIILFSWLYLFAVTKLACDATPWRATHHRARSCSNYVKYYKF